MRLLNIIIVLTVLSCSSKKIIEPSSDDFNEFTGKVFQIKGDLLVVDSTFINQFECKKQGIISDLRYKNSQMYGSKLEWSGYIDRCILGKAYNGDQASIDFVAEFIETIGAKWFDLRTDKFRGDKLFDILLRLADNDECWEDEYGTPYGFEPMVAAVNAIKKVDGEDFQVWISRNENYYDFNEILGACARVNGIKKTLVPLQKAWQEGKIVLKEYGEK